MSCIEKTGIRVAAELRCYLVVFPKISFLEQLGSSVVYKASYQNVWNLATPAFRKLLTCQWIRQPDFSAMPEWLSNEFEKFIGNESFE